jgi:hypothetical protein
METVGTKLPGLREVKSRKLGTGGIQNNEEPIGVIDVASGPVKCVDDDHLPHNGVFGCAIWSAWNSQDASAVGKVESQSLSRAAEAHERLVMVMVWQLGYLIQRFARTQSPVAARIENLRFGWLGTREGRYVWVVK